MKLIRIDDRIVNLDLVTDIGYEESLDCLTIWFLTPHIDTVQVKSEFRGKAAKDAWNYLCTQFIDAEFDN